MSEPLLRICKCGHLPYEHAVIHPEFPLVGKDGQIVHLARYGHCEHGADLLYLTHPPVSDACRCRDYDPEPWPHLAALLGSENLRPVVAP